LFIDARKCSVMVDRTHRELTDEEIWKIANTYHAWRGDHSRSLSPTGERGRVKGPTKTFPASAEPPHGKISASTAMFSRRRATSAPSRLGATTSRS
jgi:type I restriction-modification system DNA methylase subunit